MIINICIGSAMALATTGIHAEGMFLILRMARSQEKRLEQSPVWWDRYRVASVVLALFLISTIEVSIWALLYLLLGIFEGIDSAIYFSAVTFTTLGYGDIVIEGPFRLLAGFQSGIGIIMFGWSTAIVIAIVQRIYWKPENSSSIQQ